MKTVDPICKVLCKDCAHVRNTRWFFGLFPTMYYSWRCAGLPKDINCKTGKITLPICENHTGNCEHFVPKDE